MGGTGAADQFADARRLVRDHLLDEWTAERGQLWVADYGYEDATGWYLPAGSYEDLELHDPEFATEPVAHLVDKQSGEVQILALASAQARIDAMTPYGSAPQR